MTIIIFQLPLSVFYNTAKLSFSYLNNRLKKQTAVFFKQNFELQNVFGGHVVDRQKDRQIILIHSYHQIPDDHDEHEHQDAERLSSHLHTIPHGLDPFAAQHPEHDQEGVEEVLHVPARQLTVKRDLAHAVLVVLPKQLHSHHGKNEDDDGQHQRQVPQRAHRIADNLDEGVESGPRLCQLENP